MGTTIVRLGWSDPRTGAFGAHPQLGAVLDLNDGVTCTLASPGGLDMPPPPRTLALAGNIRAQGERATRAIYRANRQVTAQVILGPMASYSDLVATIRALLAWLNAPPSIPFAIMYQPAGASLPVYLDVVGAAHDIPVDEGQWLALQLEPIELVFICRPGLRGDRQVLQNLLPNPGFEAPSGPGMVAFNDTFATLNAYATQAGSAPTQNPPVGYADIVSGDAPFAWYRLDEASGTAVYDATGQLGAATLVGSPTLGVAGAISGDSDTAITCNGTSQYVTLPTSGPGSALPVGNAAWSLEAWVKLTANPGAAAVVVGFGTWGTNGACAYLGIDSGGHAFASVYGTNTAPGSVLSLNAWHHLVGTWDGTTLRCYVDGAQVGTAAPTGVSIGATGARIAANPASTTGSFFGGGVDEVAIYAAALSATRVSAHSTAGHSGASGTVASAMQLGAGTRAAFGSAAWGAINTWRLRWRWSAGATLNAYLHYTDANNYLRASITASALTLTQSIAGTANTLATATLHLTPGAWYWLMATQFPSVTGDPSDIQANVLYDAAGAPGGTMATAGPAPTADALTALVGRSQLEALGAALVCGGAYSNVHMVSLFGPGGWLMQSFGTGVASAAWEQAAANTYGGGPVASYGAGRVDVAPAGTLDACWRLYAAGQGVNVWQTAIPASVGQALALSAWVRSSGLASETLIRFTITEYDANGAQKTTSTPLGLSGNQASWTQLTYTYTVQTAATVYVDVCLRVSDTVTPGASANATVWWDNAQVWNQTTVAAATNTTQTTMPYCEVRFPQSPAQLVVSGLLGDLPAPAHLALGTALASWPLGSMVNLALGRRPRADANAQLAATVNGWYDATRTPTATAILDVGSYGGWYISTTVMNGWNPRPFSLRPADAPGTYHLIGRFLTQQAQANVGAVWARATVEVQQQPYFGAAGGVDELGYYYGPYVYPIAASALWTIVDAGQAQLPPYTLGALSDPTQNILTPHIQWNDPAPGGSACQTNWQLLLPVDGSLLVGQLDNPANGTLAVTNSWLWAYFDGLAVNRAGVGDAPAWQYSIEAGSLPNPARAAGGPGTQTTGAISINSGADPYLTLDPTLASNNTTGGAGVNQFAGYLADGNGAVLPLYAELQYTPLYLYPR
ncbi:MAG: LamG domain-containing protein [Ktedonobacterales bacterium]